MVCPIPRSGRLGYVAAETAGPVYTRFQRVRNWTLNADQNPQTRVYSGTRFGTQRIPGCVERSGSFTGFGAIPPLFAGDKFTFFGYTAPTTGVACTPGCAFSLPAIVDSSSITWDWTCDNRGVEWSVNFSSDGDLSVLPTYDDPCDDLMYCDTVCDLTFVMKDPCNNDALVEFCNITTATLTFTASTVEYSNNTTLCKRRREAGTLDWTLEVVDQNPCIIPTLGADYRFEIMAESLTNTKWILEWGQLTNIGNFNVDVEGGTVISKSHTFSMNAVKCCPGVMTPTRGRVLHPSGATLWPYATPV